MKWRLKNYQESIKQEVDSYEKINKIDKPLATLTKKRPKLIKSEMKNRVSIFNKYQGNSDDHLGIF
jgi:dsDNA-binding SOS-regulon protein